jgi:thymidine kinase
MESDKHLYIPGHFKFISGTMGGGKTEYLLSVLSQCMLTGDRMPVQLFKPTIDDRFGKNWIQSKGGAKMEADLVDQYRPEMILDLIKPETVVVGIDEGNLFYPEWVKESYPYHAEDFPKPKQIPSTGPHLYRMMNVVQKLLAMDKMVYMTALEKNARGLPFNPMVKEFLVNAHSAVKHAGPCMANQFCKRNASLVQRVSHKDRTVDSWMTPVLYIEQFTEDRLFDYLSVCERHFIMPPGAPSREEILTYLARN